MPKQNLYIGPNVNQPGLTTELIGKDANGQSVQLPVVTEKAITIFLNNQIIVPPVVSLLHPVVEGNEISKFRSDLIARYAKAWDSTKSPSILKS